MKKLLLLVLSFSLFAQELYPTFKADEIIKAQKKYGLTAKNRILDYQNTRDTFKTIKKEKLLGHVNLYLNQLLPQYDAVIHREEDHWATPKEFLAYGFGDCEDYAIIKYYTLLSLGYDKNSLFLTTVKEKMSGTNHMVLSYFSSLKESPLVLDNLSFRILTLEQRKDLEAKLFINESGVYKLQKDHSLKKTSSEHPLMRKLLQKVAKEIKASE